MRRYPEGKIKAEEDYWREKKSEAKPIPIDVYQNPNAEVFSLIRPDTQDRAKAYFGEDGKREI